MPIQLQYLCVCSKEDFLTINPNENEIAIQITNYNDDLEEIVKNNVFLTKSDVKHLIKELSLLVETPDKIYT